MNNFNFPMLPVGFGIDKTRKVFVNQHTHSLLMQLVNQDRNKIDEINKIVQIYQEILVSEN